MKEYTSAFAGIPLPEIYQQDFEDLLGELKEIAPSLELTDLKTPHITGYYLDQQSQFFLPKIADGIRSKVYLLKDANLTVGGFGYFGGDNPRVIFLNVEYPDSLREFNLEITKVLTEFYAVDNNQPFHPHMTVARLYSPEAQTSFKQPDSEIKSRLDQVSWEFHISEVVLYGVDSSKKPERQEKLIVIPVN